MQRDVAAVAPAHDAEPVGVHVRQRLQVVHRRDRVVDLVAAVVDRLVVRLAVARAAAVVGRDDHVAALRRPPCTNGNMVMPQLPCTPPCTQIIAAWPFGPRFCERLEEIGRDVQVPDAAAVGDLLEVDDALAQLRVPRFGLRPARRWRLVVGADRLVGRIGRHVESPGPLRVHRDLRARVHTLDTRLLGLRLRRRLGLGLRRILLRCPRRRRRLCDADGYQPHRQHGGDQRAGERRSGSDGHGALQMCDRAGPL